MNRPDNAFLRVLSDKSFASLSPDLEPVALTLAAMLVREEEPVKWVFFPTTCLISMISTSPDGDGVESSMVGNEGAAGLTEACGSQLAGANFLVQVDGLAWRAPAGVIRRLAFSDPGFAESAWRVAELQLLESRQSAFCQAMHKAENRLARWLLESMDRTAGRNPLPMTQEFLAAMLGIQRTTVSTLAARLQARGLIKYGRGVLELTNKNDLEDEACLCRSAMMQRRTGLGLIALEKPELA